MGRNRHKLKLVFSYVYISKIGIISCMNRNIFISGEACLPEVKEVKGVNCQFPMSGDSGENITFDDFHDWANAAREVGARRAEAQRTETFNFGYPQQTEDRINRPTRRTAQIQNRNIDPATGEIIVSRRVDEVREIGGRPEGRTYIGVDYGRAE